MLKLPRAWPKKFILGISLKLFLAFWLVILISVLISYIATMQFRHSPSQEQANPKQLTLVSQYAQKLAGKKHIKLNAIQGQFHRKYRQHLIIKKISNNKIFAPRKRRWSEIKNYLKKHPLDNPVTIDFSYTKVTSSQPIVINGEQFQLFIASKLQRKQLVSWVNQLPITVRLLMLLTVSFLSCWLLAKSFTKPLIAIQKASEDIGQGKFRTRITKFDQRSDEFGALARSFNNMAEQLENNISAHQRLLGDISHELRSPLTRLQLAVALAEKNIGKAAEQKRHLTRCETEVDRLDEMLADVLTLSRLEHSYNTFRAEDNIEISHLVEEIVNDCQYYATSRNVTIELAAEVETVLLVDCKLLASAISNVINNAVKYSPNEHVVKVRLSENNQKISLSISDQGPGVPNEMIEKLFTPFFRVADGRERSSGGTGLGLAIAQQAIMLHQGEIVAQNQVASGLKIIITLPIILRQHKNK